MKEIKKSNISSFSKPPEKQGFSIISYSNEKYFSTIDKLKTNIIFKESLDHPKSNSKINEHEIHNTIDTQNFEEKILHKKTKELLKNPQLINK